jgi:hypothetical protein
VDRELVGLILWTTLFASPIATAYAIRFQSAGLMLLSALMSLFVAFLTIFSIGQLVFLLTCLQLAAALALAVTERPAVRWAVVTAGGLSWLALILALRLLVIR